MSAPAQRMKISPGEEMRENVKFSTLLYGDLGCCYYEKWLQYQMLGLMSGLKWCTFLSPIIPHFSDILSFEKCLKWPTSRANISKARPFQSGTYLR